MDDTDILIYCAAGGLLFALLFIAWGLYRNATHHKLDKQQEVFKEEDFIEVERPGEEPPSLFTKYDPEQLRPDSPVAPVFRISEDPLDRLESWAAEAAKRPERAEHAPTGMDNYYMTIDAEYGQTWKHPFLPKMKPTQWVRIVAPNDQEARKIAFHFSGGYYATLKFQREFLAIKHHFPDGEYEALSSLDYWSFQDQNTTL